MSIIDFVKKSKHLLSSNTDIVISIIIILTAFGGFGLGRLSMIEEKSGQLSNAIVQNSKILIAQNSDLKEGGYYVGSKNGNKYHFPWCSAVKKIKEENKIIFDTKEIAEKAGYSPSGNCRGL